MTAPSPKSVTIRVPATTTNLGPGFDTLGIAVQLYNHVRVTRVEGKGVDLVSPIAEADRAGATAMVSEAAKLFFRRTRKASFAMDVSLSGDVPIARGLGSSVTARLGVVAALNELTRARLTRQEMLDMVTELEGHPDNAASALFGGFTAAGIIGKAVRCLNVAVDARVRFIALIPRFEVSTAKARKLVPAMFSKADTVHNLNRAALISAAFAAGRYDALHGLFDDRVHQPYREQLIPQLSRVIRAGEKAGAIGGWLSGSGSTIMCIALRHVQAVAEAMQRQLKNSDVKVLAADNAGTVIAH
jgi:homoserine kinase